LLIDADMRKGRLNDAFMVPAGPGLSDILMGKCRLGNAVHRSVVPNVDFVAAGSPASSPADLLTARVAELLRAEASSAYDYVVVDTPPVLAAADAAILAQCAGAVFLIARAEVTSLRELDEAEKRLSQRGIAVEGVIYTGVDVSKRRNDIYSYGGYEYQMTH
jgi:tyrosine-protein kinase Etk/Wzc